MSIRGDMEARYWAELGHDKPRLMAEHFFDCLKDPNVWLKLSSEYTNDQVVTFLEMLDVIRGKILTFSDAERAEAPTDPALEPAGRPSISSD